jgi:hypothetical protein
MNYLSEGLVVPLLIVDWSMEHSHRRTAVDDDAVPSSSRRLERGAQPHRLLGHLLAKALAPLRAIGARLDPASSR